MKSKEEQIEVISKVINSTRENLKPLSLNFIFWGSLIVVMSLIHYSIPQFIQYTEYSSLLFWTILPILGMIFTIVYNIKIRKILGYETYLNRVIKIIWGIFNLSWLVMVVMSLLNGINNPVPEILFLLSTTLITTGIIIKFKPIIIGGILLMLFTVYINFNPNINFLIVNIIGVSLGMLVPGISLYFSKVNE
ncbi:MAG: hypothetical protein EVA43_05750 [Flavobacteriales bacterium]|nr:MAG: hypothetical protein EVA43_05750 [Flavobacteriales bacterium]